MRLLSEYMFIRAELGGPIGSTIGFRNATWFLIDKGQSFVAEDKQGPVYFGKRIAFWARFQHTTTGKIVFFMNHHGPLPVNSGGICGAEVTAYNLLHVISQNAQPGDAVIFVGDFNSDGASPTIAQLGMHLGAPSF